MVDQVIMLLPEYRLQRSALINQFLIDCGYSQDLCVVLAEYEKETDFGPVKCTCLGIEALHEKSAFYWYLKGPDELRGRLAAYEIRNGKKY